MIAELVDKKGTLRFKEIIDLHLDMRVAHEDDYYLVFVNRKYHLPTHYNTEKEAEQALRCFAYLRNEEEVFLSHRSHYINPRSNLISKPEGLENFNLIGNTDKSSDTKETSNVSNLNGQREQLNS